MKRSLLLASAATLVSGAALAQSSVTVYGRLNESVERQKTGNTSIYKVQDSSSRIGFKGVEDLGGGLKAFFLIEHGFAADTGAASATFWGRESNVGLMGDFGKFRIGNMGPSASYFALADWIDMHNHGTGTSQDAFYLYPATNMDNAVAYKTPDFAGFNVEAQVGLGEGVAPKKKISVAGNYDSGPLHFGLAYASDGNGVLGIGKDQKEIGLRAVGEFGPFTVGGYFIRNSSSKAAGNEAKRNAFRIAGMYTFDASEIHLNIGRAGKISVNGTDVADTEATQWTIAYNYNLSKRTKVYAFYTSVKNGANIDYGPLGNTGVFGKDNDFSSIALGIRHNF